MDRMLPLISHIGPILSTALAVYAFATGIFLISENRRPQATLAWMLVLFSLPGIGLLAYLLFGRNTKAFAKQSKLLRQNIETNAKPLVSQILSRQDAEITELERDSASRKK